MAEWLKAHDSKSCGPKGLGGSNPLASAIKINRPRGVLFYLAPFLRKTALIVSKIHLMSNIKLQWLQ